MTEPQRWKRDMWAGRLAMLCYVVVNYAETWRVGLLPRAVSTALFRLASGGELIDSLPLCTRFWSWPGVPASGGDAILHC